MTKLTYLIDGGLLLKYQLLLENFDAFVSVKSDEDLCHMFDDHDRHDSAGSLTLENQMASSNALELRHIDAINGIIRATPQSTKPHPIIIVGQRGTSVSLACLSPGSPMSCTTEAKKARFRVVTKWAELKYRVKSSPSMCNLNTPQARQTSHSVQHPHNYYQNMVQSPHLSYQSSKPPIDPHRNGEPERLFSVKSIGRAEGVTYQVDCCHYNYYSAPQQNQGTGCCARCMHYDDCSHRLDRRMIDSTESPIISPLSLSPQHGFGILRHGIAQ